MSRHREHTSDTLRHERSRDHDRERDRDRDRDRERRRGGRDHYSKKDRRSDRDYSKDKRRDKDEYKDKGRERKRERDKERSKEKEAEKQTNQEPENTSKRKREESPEEEPAPVVNIEKTAEELRQERLERWKAIKEQNPTAQPEQASVEPPKAQPEPVQVEIITVPDEQPETPSKKPPVPIVDIFGDSDDNQGIVGVKPLERRDVEPSDDGDGYYCFRLGEVLGGKYMVVGYHGKGVFGNVLKCKDMGTNTDVAIKLLRNNEHMKRTGKKEVKMLQLLRETDPLNKYNNIRLLDNFEDRDHLCLVFEPMDMNMRQLLKKTGGQGLRVTAVRIYAFKLLKALYHLDCNNIIHADIKPDNILIDKGRTVVKLADLGSAMEAQEAEPMPMLVSRYYRPPEVILGIHFSQKLDMFSFGCCLFEFATGRPLFDSDDNNHHLKLIQELKGPMPKRLLQRARFRDQYFDQANNFLEQVPDPVDKSRVIVKKIRFDKPTRDLTEELLISDPNAEPEERKQILLLADLINQCLELDPDKRIVTKEALKHSLFEDSAVAPVAPTKKARKTELEEQ